MSPVHTILPERYEPLRLTAYLHGPHLPPDTPATVLVEAYDDTEEQDEPCAVLVLSPRQADRLAESLRQIVEVARRESAASAVARR